MQHPEPMSRRDVPERVRGEVIHQRVEARVIPPERPEPPTVLVVRDPDPHPGPVRWPPLEKRTAACLIATAWVVFLALGFIAGGAMLGVCLATALIATVLIVSQT